MLEASILVIFPMCMAFGATSDMISMTIPNRISVLLIVSFVIIAPLTGMDWATFGFHLAAAASVFVVCFILFALNAMGGGDAKILAASALWYGFNADLVYYLVLVSLIGAALTFIVFFVRLKSDILILTGLPLPLYISDVKAGIPYGLAIGLGALITFPDTNLFSYILANPG